MCSCEMNARSRSLELDESQSLSAITQKKKAQKSATRQAALKLKATKPVQDTDRRAFFGEIREFTLYGGVAWYFVKEVNAAI